MLNIEHVAGADRDSIYFERRHRQSMSLNVENVSRADRLPNVEHIALAYARACAREASIATAIRAAQQQGHAQTLTHTLSPSGSLSAFYNLVSTPNHLRISYPFQEIIQFE
jgi:hypothetical protein